ncbi:YcaO-like family protein [Microvirga thermotolerans]|uniref:YcaO-like family protein n=1 Tax=Microvirga thermotolerans TaxID=2651334 RepID=UPI001883DA6D|nr:YcaO-like family protein [Microvirga thermotolerans]
MQDGGRSVPHAAPAGPKTFFQGTHRVCAPAETLARLRPSLGELGITRVADITGLDYVGIPVAISVRPLARGLTVQQGKGLTREAAKASAAMESVESHCAQLPRPPFLWSSVARLAPGDAVLPRHLLRRPLRRDASIPWMEGVDILRGRSVLVPEELVTTDFSVPQRPGHGRFLASSNGLAAGNTPAEAQLHALCELIERDALTLWRHMPPERRAARRIDLRTIEDEAAAELLRRYADARLDVAFWETTSDIGVPSFFCTVDDRAGRPPFLGRFGGGGCHPNAGVAACRALCEAAQSRLAFIHGAREDLPPGRYALVGWHENLERLIFDAGMQDGRAGRAPRARSFDGPSVEADLAAVAGRLETAGIGRIAVVDLTDPQVGIPCVRAVAPGLEGMDRNPAFRPGRRLGRRECR